MTVEVQNKMTLAEKAQQERNRLLEAGDREAAEASYGFLFLETPEQQNPTSVRQDMAEAQEAYDYAVLMVSMADTECVSRGDLLEGLESIGVDKVTAEWELNHAARDGWIRSEDHGGCFHKVELE